VRIQTAHIECYIETHNNLIYDRYCTHYDMYCTHYDRYCTHYDRYCTHYDRIYLVGR